MRSRGAEGYSMRQLIHSHIPDVGGETKVSAAEINEALKKQQAGKFFGPRK